VDTIHLIGAEQVERAGYKMQEAAQEMQRAVSSLSEELHRQRMFMDEWLLHLRAIIEEVTK
jgi:hypothetical protein